MLVLLETITKACAEMPQPRCEPREALSCHSPKYIDKEITFGIRPEGYSSSRNTSRREKDR